MDTRTRVMIIGGFVGGLIGVVAAQLFLRSAERRAEKEGEAELPSLQPADVIKLTLSVLGVLKLVDRLSEPAE